MGNQACGCGANGQRQKPILYDVPNKDWADCVNSLNLAGVKMLHQQDPDLINECVSEHGYIAIHVAVKNKHFDLFIYILKYGGNLNTLTGDDGNSCLHLAVINKDIRIIRELFACDIDDTLINNSAKTAADLICDNSFRRKYMRIKNTHKLNNNYNNNNNYQKSKSHLETSIGGVLLNNITSNQLKQVIIDSNEDILYKNNNNNNNNYEDITEKQNKIKKRNEQMFKEKYIEISSRNSSNIYLTEFGEIVGCEIDEIAYYVQDLNVNGHLSKVWDKWVKKNKITKFHHLYKVMYGITAVTLQKKQENNYIKPSSKPIQRLTSKIYKMLPRYKSSVTNIEKKHKRHVLTRNDFINNFHTYLYHAHQQFINEHNQ